MDLLGFEDNENTRTILKEKRIEDLRDSKGDSPLHVAFEKYTSDLLDENIIDFLIESKSDLNSIDSLEGSPLHVACLNDNISLEMLGYLIDKKSNLNLKNSQKKTPLHAHLCDSFSIEEEKIKLLVEKKSDLNIKNSLYETAFHTLCQRSSKASLIQLFVENKAHFFEEDNESFTPLEYIKNIPKETLLYLFCLPNYSVKKPSLVRFSEISNLFSLYSQASLFSKELFPFPSFLPKDRLHHLPLFFCF